MLLCGVASFRLLLALLQIWSPMAMAIRVATLLCFVVLVDSDLLGRFFFGM